MELKSGTGYDIPDTHHAAPTSFNLRNDTA